MRLAALVAAAVLAAPAAAHAAAIERFAPVVVHDSAEADPLTSVQAFAGRFPGVAAGTPRPALYARRVGPWLQYWMLFAHEEQDRRLLRTGRREGDWELAQFRLERGRVVEGVVSQHESAERCGKTDIRFRGRRPVIFIADGSHAAYFVRGVRDRTWPAPNDEADGRGEVARPRVVSIGGNRRRPWLRRPDRWGASRAGWFPGERTSPGGPMDEPPGAWADPAAWAGAADDCMARRCDRRGECDLPETLASAALAGLGLLGAMWLARRRLRRADARRGAPAAGPAAG